MIVLMVMLSLLATPPPSLSAIETAEAQAIMQQIRCVVCDGQSIADSDAALAQDMRVFVTTRVAAGQGAADIRAALAERYGDEVLLRPPMDWRTAPLWLAPLVLLLLGGGMLVLAGRRRD